MYHYSVFCDCGKKVSRSFDNNPKAGVILGFQCNACGEILLSQMPGRRKYQQQKSKDIELAIFNIFMVMKPRLTVRQIYYALTVSGFVKKTEKGYRQTTRYLTKMRRENALPYNWIADNTRWQIKPTTYSGLDAALERMQESYRRDIWAEQRDHVEIWVEKDALAGVISPITNEFDVPLFVARGYGSITFVYDAAEVIKSIGKPAYIYHFGDHDPSGVDAAEKIRDGLREHGADIHFERIAITSEQIDIFSLPTRSTKKQDPRAKKWGDKPSVELDAMPAPILRGLVRNCIEQHINPWTLQRTQQIESQEKATLESVTSQINNIIENSVQVPNFEIETSSLRRQDEGS